MALYTTAGSPDVRVVTKDVGQELNCIVELWPYPYQLDHIRGSNGKTYRFQIYVDECGLLKQLPLNEVATYLAHPLNLVRGRVVVGDALIVPWQKKVNYTLEDYEAMRDGVWINDEESNLDLVEANSAGPDATFRFSSKETKTKLKEKEKQDRPKVKLSLARLQSTLNETPNAATYNKQDLRVFCSKAQLSVYGTKRELAESLLSVCEDASEEEKELNIDMEKLRISADQPRSKKGYTVSELKAFCKEKNLSVGGKKEELAARLLAQ